MPNAKLQLQIKKIKCSMRSHTKPFRLTSERTNIKGYPTDDHKVEDVPRKIAAVTFKVHLLLASAPQQPRIHILRCRDTEIYA
jgi:hypothetical protein